MPRDVLDESKIHPAVREKIATHRLPEWRERLRILPAGTRLAIGYLRGGKAAKAGLVLADRIAPRWK